MRVDRSGVGTTAVRIETLPKGGFLFHTREPGGEFDVWLESEEDVVASLADYELESDDEVRVSQTLCRPRIPVG